MNKKTIIQIIVIVGAFLGSGLVLYNGMFKNKAAPVAVTTSPTKTESEITNILPFGTALDFRVLTKQNLEYGTLAYPKLDPKEVGMPVQTLIKSPAVTQE